MHSIYEEISFKIKEDLDEFNHKKAILRKSYHLRGTSMYENIPEKEEYENLCSICWSNDKNEDSTWQRFEELTLKYATEVDADE